uniref:FGENESH: predicted gene_11.70 protein n=1 Tax=Rhodotorula toruloides TaxID=5286 RepID=A0A0K3CL83_RHOTO
MGTRPDPTNANAVPGPSRAPSIPSAPSQPASSTSSAHPDSLAVPATGAAPAAPGAQAVRKDPVRRADGPIIVKTVVAGDGVREVPSAFEHCEVEDLITLIASMLDRLIEHNDRIPLTPNSLTRFHSRAPPNISVRDYLFRIAKYTNVEPCCLLILLPYVDKASVAKRLAMLSARTGGMHGLAV